MIELRRMNVRHLVITERSHVANDSTIKCDCTGLMLFRSIMSARNSTLCKYCRICIGIYTHAEFEML